MSSERTAQDQALREGSIFRLFLRYTIPTIAAMVVTGIYSAIDGMFIGHVLGEDGLAAIILGYPIGAVLYAVGSMIGMGGATLVSIYLGEEKIAKARKVIGVSFSLCLVFSVLLAVVGIGGGGWLLKWIGAEGKVLTMGVDYLFWYFAMGGFAVISMAFTSILRNDGQVAMVTWILIIGGVMNVILDWLFIVVFPYELSGAAVATMLSQAITAVLALSHFFWGKTRLRLSLKTLSLCWSTSKGILRLGFSSLLMTLYISLVLLFHSKAFLWVGQSIHLAAYSVVGYIEALFYFVFQGIALGIQPITSFNTGAGLHHRVKQVRNLAFAVTIFVSGLSIFVLYAFPEYAVRLFTGDNQALIPPTLHGMTLYFWGIPFEGLVLVGAAYFQSVNQVKDANILTMGKILLFPVVLVGMASQYAVDGVWLALPISSAVLALWMLYALNRQETTTLPQAPQQA